MKRYKVNYYSDEGSYRFGCPIFSEVFTNRDVAISIARSKCSPNGFYKIFNIEEIN